MNKLVVLCLVISILALQTPLVMGATIEATSEVLVVDEEELVEITTQQKFNDITKIMQKLVQQNISTEEEVELEEIEIINFAYSEQNKIKIYYTLD